MLEERAKEISEYLGESYEDALSKVETGELVAKKSWRDHDPKTEDERREWYRTTKAYLYDLSKSHELNPEIRRVYNQVLDICSSRGGEILDFGAGIGTLIILLAEGGLNVTYLDIKGVTSDFAKWRINRRGLKVNFIESNDEPTCLEEKYDVIICIDVLEHLENPVAYLKEFHEHLRKDGLLILKVDFNFSDDHPMHLEENRVLQPNLSEVMDKIGFKRVFDLTWKEFFSIYSKVRSQIPGEHS